MISPTGIKAVLIRAAKTAVQTLLGTLTVQQAIAGDINPVRAALVAAASAGIAVVWNAVLLWSATP